MQFSVFCFYNAFHQMDSGIYLSIASIRLGVLLQFKSQCLLQSHINKRISDSQYILFALIRQKQTQSMTSGTTSQSQASYLNTKEEKPNYEANPNSKLLDESAATAVMAQLSQAMAVEEGERFEECLRALNVLLQKGYCYLFMTHTLLMRKMMNHFTKLGKQLESDGEDAKIQLRMLFVLSVIAEVIRSNPKFYYPFTRKFLLTVFTIDRELLEHSQMKKDIMAILAVIYENLSRQPKLLEKYSLTSNLKIAVLDNYALIEEIFTLKMMNKTISNLANKCIAFSVADFHKYQVLETVSNFISRNQMELFLIKMKMTMLCMNKDSLIEGRKL